MSTTNTTAQLNCTGKMINTANGKSFNICFIRTLNMTIKNNYITKYTITDEDEVEIDEVEFTYFKERDSIMIKYYDKENSIIMKH